MYQRQAGFSLIELCVTVAIAALIMAVGVPSFQSLSSENHASSHLDEINSALRLTRHLSVEHNRTAMLCPRVQGSNPMDSNPDCEPSVSPDWNNGWIVKLENNSGDFDVVMTSNHPVDGTTWSVENDSSGTGVNAIVFGSTGTLRTPSSPSTTLSVSLAGCTKITQVALTGSLSFNAIGC